MQEAGSSAIQPGSQTRLLAHTAAATLASAGPPIAHGAMAISSGAAHGALAIGSGALDLASAAGPPMAHGAMALGAGAVEHVVSGRQPGRTRCRERGAVGQKRPPICEHQRSGSSKGHCRARRNETTRAAR